MVLIEGYKAGSPTKEGVYWISLKPYSIVKLFEEKHHIKVSWRDGKTAAQRVGLWLSETSQTIGNRQLWAPQ